LGYSIRNGAARSYLDIPLCSHKEMAENTKKAAHYGFHATMLAPFRTDQSEATAAELLDEILSKEPSIQMPPLEIVLMHDYFPALAPLMMPYRLSELERNLVLGMRELALPPSFEERKKREPLTPRQRRYCKKLGYPFVLEEFYFHMTLGDGPNARFFNSLSISLGEELKAPFVLDSLCLCREENGQPFVLVKEFFLGESKKNYA
jgi:hypothetical protein